MKVFDTIFDLSELIEKVFNTSKYDDFGKTVLIINLIMTTVLMVFYLYQNIYSLIGVVTPKKKWKEAKVNHKYAYVICAHDEEPVIGQLIDSIYAQDYPKELMRVFVCADNCTDKTAEIAREHGAIVYERFSEKKGKAFALNYVLNTIFDEYANELFEAVFFFDADNLVSKTFTTEMNKVYDAGYLVATSYRDSKNYDHNWVSACSSMAFYRECALIHHSRALLDIGTYVSGTGFYVDYQLLKARGGWSNMDSLIEDIDFSIDCAIDGVKIGYSEDAIFFDEQPYTFKDSTAQRLRWCKGTHQCFARILKHPLRYLKTRPSVIKWEMFCHVAPMPIISTLWSFIYIVLMTINSAINIVGTEGIWWEYFETTIVSVIWLLVAIFGMAFFHAIFVTIRKGKTIKAPLWKQLIYCLVFPFYASTFLPTSFAALFINVKWKKISHTEQISIDQLEKKE